MKRSDYIQVEEQVKLHITDQGDGKPIIFIHGWPENDEIFKHYYGPLSRHGYRVIGITLRGYGLSDRTPGSYDLERFSQDILKVIEHLELKDITLVGFSMGGAVAAYCIAQYQPPEIQKLVLIAGNVPLAVNKDEFQTGIPREALDGAITALAIDRAAMVDVYGSIFQLEESFMPRETGDWINAINMEASPEATVDGLAMLRDLDLRPVLHKIQIPTALFYALNDNLVSYELAKISNKEIPDSYIVDFEIGGHWLLFKEREKVLRELVKFVG